MIITRLKLIDTSKLIYDKKEVDRLMKIFKDTKENLNNTNKQKKNSDLEKYNGYIVEDYLSQVFKLKRNDNLFGWWDLKDSVNGTNIYYDSKSLTTNKKVDGTSSFTNEQGKVITYPSGITNSNKKYNNGTLTSKGYCIYLQAKQVLEIKKGCDENNVKYNNYYFIVNYFDRKGNSLKSLFSKKLSLENVLKTLRMNENPPNTDGSDEDIDNFIVHDIYIDGEYEIIKVN